MERRCIAPDAASAALPVSEANLLAACRGMRKECGMQWTAANRGYMFQMERYWLYSGREYERRTGNASVAGILWYIVERPMAYYG